jgi:pimeloyl-ACP methyl ester carboxylesterase
MHVAVNGTRLWFDVEGAALTPDGPRLRERPQVILLHGGPGSYDHSYFKPHFGQLAKFAQVIYLDLRDHGRSARNTASGWDFETCADDVRAFCDVVGIADPIVLGHSLGGCVAMLYGARHPGHPAALILQSTMARFDLGRLVHAFRIAAGDEVAELARRDYSGDPVSDEQWADVFAAFGPHIPSPDQLARRIRNPEIGAAGMDLLRRLDVVDQLAAIRCPTLVFAGRADPVTPVSAAQEIVDALPPGLGRLEVMDGAGHFMWLDRPDRYWALLDAFVTIRSPERAA